MAEETKKCPYCGEEILAVAIKWKHCGERLDAPVSTPPAKSSALPFKVTWSNQVLVRVLGWAALASVVSLVVFLVGSAFLRGVVDAAADAETEGLTKLLRNLDDSNSSSGAFGWIGPLAVFFTLLPLLASVVQADCSRAGLLRSGGVLLVVSVVELVVANKQDAFMLLLVGAAVVGVQHFSRPVVRYLVAGAAALPIYVVVMWGRTLAVELGLGWVSDSTATKVGLVGSPVVMLSMFVPPLVLGAFLLAKIMPRTGMLASAPIRSLAASGLCPGCGAKDGDHEGWCPEAGR